MPCFEAELLARAERAEQALAEKEAAMKSFVEHHEAETKGLEQALAEAREDTLDLNWLEQRGLSTRMDDTAECPGVHCWKDVANGAWKWTAQRISSEFKTLREAVRAARKEDPRA